MKAKVDNRIEALKKEFLSIYAPKVKYEDWCKNTYKKRFLMICHDQEIDRRILQQASALLEHGMTGLIIALSHNNNDTIDFEKINSTTLPVHRIGLGNIVPDCKVYWHYILRQRWLQKFKYGYNTLSKANWFIYRILLKLKYRGKNVDCPLPFDNVFYMAGSLYPADLVVAHDLPALKAAAQLAKEWNALLMYDSHELYSEQKSFSKIQRKILDKREKEWIRYCNQVTTMGNCIAQIIADKNKVSLPKVIMNVTQPQNKHITQIDILSIRARLNLKESDTVILYQGAVFANRNIENLLKGFLLLNKDNTHLVFMGPVDALMKVKLEKLINTTKAKTGYIHFLDPVPQDCLLEVTKTADFGVIPYLPCDLNTKFCMPNKFFEYIQAGLPILASEQLYEVKLVLNKIEGGGLLHLLDNAKNFVNGLERMLERDLKKDRQTLLNIRHQFSWEKEQEKYLSIIKELKV